ncbi:FCD domain-containing protein [Streptomyces sp. ME02-7008A-1]|uniref:FadR/GntR family transcriptional regulator n=1 Tax=unclassified Streptomyces TaxID=2593676 RepID=UPI0029B4EB09|nr:MULTISPECIES: FCD domain-containing protein [unclassified Streptomyces]MDX3183786.1 FCD domain-containing protein [Streptomyces sp. ME02-7008A-1]MDX3304238.1 FCD domain-containing protein [Streptomyces sp. ME02-7008A]
MAAYAGRGIHGQVVEALGYRIVSGRIAQGDTIDVRSVAEEMDISLTVMRESLKVLAGKGLIDSRQKRGTFVQSEREWNFLDADVIRWRVAGGHGAKLLGDLAEVRAIIEPAVARHAAARRSERDLVALEAMGRTEGDAEAAAGADTAFHRALFRATGNDLLARFDLLLEPGLRERDLLVHTHRQDDDPVPSHRAVLDAVRDADPDRAHAAMTELLDKAGADAETVTGRAATGTRTVTGG